MENEQPSLNPFELANDVSGLNKPSWWAMLAIGRTQRDLETVESEIDQNLTKAAAQGVEKAKGALETSEKLLYRLLGKVAEGMDPRFEFAQMDGVMKVRLTVKIARLPRFNTAAKLLAEAEDRCIRAHFPEATEDGRDSTGYVTWREALQKMAAYKEALAKTKQVGGAMFRFYK